MEPCPLALKLIPVQKPPQTKRHCLFFKEKKKMKKNDVLVLTAIDYTEKAQAVCKTDNMVVFVSEMMIGEIAEVLILKVNTNVAYGKIQKLLNASPDRVAPRCPIATQCGGCQLQHMSPSHQLSFKENHVKQLFKRNLDYTEDFDAILGMDDPWYYRNKSQVPYEVETNSFGFYRAHSHTILPFESCFIQSEDSNRILKSIQDFYQERHLKADNLKTVLIKKGFKTQELMAILIVKNTRLPLKEDLTQFLQKEYPSLKAILLNINNREDNVVLGDRYIPLTIHESIQDELSGLKFNISAPSFFQVNPLQTEKMYGRAINYAALKKTDTVLDLYCGLGTIASFAALKAKKVIGVEVLEQAIEDAKANAELNQLTNLEWIVGDAASATQTLIENKQKVDVVIVDPPRKGLDAVTLEAILTLKPKRLVYVSCDPGTLVRDLKVLQGSYQIEKVGCVDMFPQTVHVETVTLLKLKTKSKMS